MAIVSLRLPALAVLIGLASPLPAHGQWTANGAPVCTAPGSQRSPKVVPDGTGGAVVFWIDGRERRPDLYAQRLTAEGRVAVGWPVNGVFLGGLVGELGTPVGIPDGTGGAIVVWEDARDVSTSLHNIYAQRVTGQGTIAPGWPLDGLPVCTAPRDQRDPRLVSDGQGGAYITWFDLRNDPTQSYLNPDIFAQRVTADGNIAPGWPVDGLPICTRPEDQWEPTLAPDGAGGAIIAWYDGRNQATTGGDIFAQRVTPSGEIAPGWVPDGVAICTVPGNQGVPETISDGTGGAILIWLDGRVDPDWDLYAQRVQGDGTLAPGWPADGLPLSTSPGYQFFLDAAADGMGGALVVWEDYTQPTASDIYLQRVTGEGVIPPGWPPNGVPVCVVPGFQLRPKLAPDGTGGAFLVWEDPRSGTNRDIYAQHITASGAVAAGWPSNGLAISTEPTGAPRPAIAPDGFGGAILTWPDSRNGNSDIFAHKLNLDGPVPVLLALATAEAEADRVVLTWSGVGAADLAATVERRTESRDWETLGTAVPDGPDRLRYEDTAIAPGTRYAYRLSYPEQGVLQFTAPAWVEVPALTLHLAGFHPNPARGAVAVRLTLPRSGPATLEAFDARGRVAARQDVGALGPGVHTVSLGAPSLAPGIYWLRLTHGGQQVVARGVVLP